MKEFLYKYFYTADKSLNLLGKFSRVLILLLVAQILVLIVNAIVKKLVVRNKFKLIKANKRKRNSISNMISSFIKYLIYFIIFIMILETFNVNTSSILAAAGIGGLAVGFAAQSLIKDIITGFFILFEDQFSTGDHIKVGDYEGIVQHLGFRVTTLKDFSGEVHIIPNSNISTVTNKSKNIMRSRIYAYISHDENLDKFLDDLNKELKAYKNSKIVEGPSVIGVTHFDEHKVEIAIVAKTVPLSQWETERELRKLLLDKFYSKGLEIPVPKLEVQNKKT